jgi:hypothetical protein
MKQLRIPLRVVFYKEAGHWIAHCLEFDLVGDGRTQKAALKMLNNAIEIQLEASLKHHNLRNLFTPADGRYFEMFAAGKDVAVGSLDVEEIVEKPVTFDAVQAREYSGRVPALA